MTKEQVNKTLQKQSKHKRKIEDTVTALLSFSNRSEQAEALGISRQALYKRIVNYPEINEYITTLTKIADSVLQIASIKASENLIELLGSSDERVSIEASKEILDRVGITKELALKTPFNQDKELNINIVSEGYKNSKADIAK